MPRVFFVTGTDTGVGKTLVTAALLCSAAAHGLRAAAVKPLAAGADRVAGRPANADALLLQRCGSVRLSYDVINPVLLQLPIAPHIAAAAEQRVLEAQALANYVAAAAQEPLDVLLIEGAGGWLVPLNATETMADVVQIVGCPVILVVGMRLGCLNHALLTAGAIRSAGLKLAGWVANTIDATMPVFDENVLTLQGRLPALRLGTVPWLGDQATPENANNWLDATALWGH